MNKRNTVIICEIGLNANGNVDIAKKLIDVAKDAGCDFVKFQKRTIEDVYLKEFLDNYRESPFGITQRAQKEGLEFNLDQYKEIDSYCKEKDIQWFCSPWDIKSIDFLKENFSDMPFLKIPSAKIVDDIYLQKCKESGFNLIMSTGMSNYEIIYNAIKRLGGVDNNNVRYLLGCTASYPCPSEDINLNQIKWLKHYFGERGLQIGYSDHSGGILFPAMAVGLGAEIIEVHITLSRSMYGSDQSASLEPEGLRHLVKYIEELEKGLGNVSKEIMPSEISIIKKLRG